MQKIRYWSVVGADRLTGAVYSRPGQSDGRTIITSSVIHVRIMGESTGPVAFTASGTQYQLGEPAAELGVDGALAFLARMNRLESIRELGVGGSSTCYVQLK